ncbi:MAG: ComEA family DNA-binding protein, partial [Azonexus sp.]
MPARFLMVLAACLLWVGAALAQININTASQAQLDGLKGIGPSKAKAIVDYRRKNGPFQSVDDLLNVPGIGESTLQGLRRDVVVSGAGTPPAAARQENVRSPAPARPATP